MQACKYRVPRWMAFAVPITFIGGAVFCAAFYSPWITRARIPSPRHSLPPGTACPTATPFEGFESRFIGHEDVDIVAQFGPPTGCINGHYGSPPMSVKRTYPEAFTYVYTSSSGSLYLSFCNQRGRWVCFVASWLPEGAAF
jgi:hypothetical protein